MFQKNISKCRSSGFTLVEVVVYVSIVAILLVAGTYFVWDVLYGKTKSQSISETQQNARFSVERLNFEIRGAQDINASDFGINLADPLNAGKKLSLKMSDGTKDPTLFDVSNYVLRIKQGSLPTYELTSSNVKVTNLVLTNLSHPSGRTKNIKFEMTVEHANPSGMPEWEFSTDVRSTAELLDR